MFLVKDLSTYGFKIIGANINIIMLLLFFNNKLHNSVANEPQNKINVLYA